MKKRNIVIVTHKFVTHPDDELVYYLNQRKYPNVLHICHSFYEAPDRKSYYRWYKNGKLYKEKFSLDYKQFPEPLVYLKEILYTCGWLLLLNIRWDLYIGMDGLCIFAGNLLKKFKKVKKTAYWAIDFVPKNRFPNKIANSIYHSVNIHGYKNSDEMWDLSPRMKEAREKYLGIKDTDYKKLRVVPYGMWTEKIEKIPFKTCEQGTVVFMGRIAESQGAQLIVNAIPEIVRKIPSFHFKVIGNGPYKDELVKLAKKKGLAKYCSFLGRIEDHREVEREIAKSAIALAPYIRSMDTWTYYADPGKVKTYLACGVPVLLTDLPWNTKEIVKAKCGEVISEDPSDIAMHIIALLNPKKNQQYRNNAAKYAKNFDYGLMFEQLNL